jgi:hypothetical protein
MSKIDFSHPRFVDLTGARSGRLTVLGPSHRNTHRQTVWRCACDCGVTTLVVGNSLKNGHSTSCGCTRGGRTTHGLSNSAEYKAWSGMWQRCTNPKESGYPAYRLRRPPPEWRSFSTFYADMGPRPEGKESIERIDNSRPYGPENCTWATRSEQNRNKSGTLLVDIGSRSIPLVEACEILGLSYRLVYTRMHRLGWTFEKAVFKPVRRKVFFTTVSA